MTETQEQEPSIKCGNLVLVSNEKVVVHEFGLGLGLDSSISIENYIKNSQNKHKHFKDVLKYCHGSYVRICNNKDQDCYRNSGLFNIIEWIDSHGSAHKSLCCLASVLDSYGHMNPMYDYYDDLFINKKSYHICISHNNLKSISLKKFLRDVKIIDDYTFKLKHTLVEYHCVISGYDKIVRYKTTSQSQALENLKKINDDDMFIYYDEDENTINLENVYKLCVKDDQLKIKIVSVNPEPSSWRSHSNKPVVDYENIVLIDYVIGNANDDANDDNDKDETISEKYFDTKAINKMNSELNQKVHEFTTLLTFLQSDQTKEQKKSNTINKAYKIEIEEKVNEIKQKMSQMISEIDLKIV